MIGIGSSPPLNFDLNDTCKAKGLEAYTLLDPNMITICPRTFTKRLLSLDTYKDRDNIGYGLSISKLQSISSILLHEFLHFFFEDISKCDFLAR